MDCYYCKAKEQCNAAVQQGSVMCMVNQMKYGGTHADDPEPDRQRPRFCSACGQPLVIRERNRYCNNPRCYMRYRDV